MGGCLPSETGELIEEVFFSWEKESWLVKKNEKAQNSIQKLNVLIKFRGIKFKVFIKGISFNIFL